MSNPKKVWAVSTGEYSDYRVLCVAPTKKAAEAIAEGYNEAEASVYSRAEVQEMLYLTEPAQPTRELIVAGQEHDAYRSSESLFMRWPWEYAPTCRAVVFGSGKHKGLRVEGTDHERVRKVYSEKRAALLAKV